MKLIFDDRYECKLSTRALVGIEEDLGSNPLNELFGDDIPQLKVLLTILYHSIKACDNKFKKEDIYDIFDEYCEGDGDIMKLSKFIFDLYDASGLIKQPTEEVAEATEGAEKN